MNKNERGGVRTYAATVLAALLMGTMAFAGGVGQGLWGRGGSSGTPFTSTQARAATGWTYAGGVISPLGGGTAGLHILDASLGVIRYGATKYFNIQTASGADIALGAATERLRIVTGGLIVDSAQTKGTVTLAAGTGTATVISGCVPVCSSQTANHAYCTVSGTTLTVTGTGTDAVTYHCI